MRAGYITLRVEERLRKVDEHNTIRSPPIYGKVSFLKLELDENLHGVHRY